MCVCVNRKVLSKKFKFFGCGFVSRNEETERKRMPNATIAVHIFCVYVCVDVLQCRANSQTIQLICMNLKMHKLDLHLAHSVVVPKIK